MWFDDSFISEVAERNDIAEVVSEYVKLGKRSGSNLFGLCPFHNEKTPSFSVSPDKQIYHCFGCGKGGGVISFIMEIEGLTYPEAVEFLARRAGMALPQQETDDSSRLRARLYALNKDAARFFHETLRAPGGEKARQYLAQRQITSATATSFGLGYAPESWDALKKAMLEKGYTDQELFSADLIRKGKSGGSYDTFRNRLVFPVIDVRGNVTGFSGRIIGDGEPKYLNTKETPVYNKGRLLFGLNLAKKSKSGYILLVEGNVDVVSLHQAGFDSAVAALGTALTNEQAQLISRYTGEVILAYDSDGAGLKASQRSIDILEKLDVKVRVLRWEGAKDPDEYIKKYGPGAFRNLIEKSESQIDYRLKNIRSRYDLSIPEQKVDYLHEATRLVAGFPGAVERQVYAARIAELAGISAEAVQKEVEQRRGRLLKAARKEFEKGSRPAAAVQPADRALRYSNPSSALAEEGVVRLLYLDPSLSGAASSLSGEDFTSEALGHIFTVLQRRITQKRAITVTLLADELSAREINLLVSILEKPEIMANAGQSLSDYIKAIRRQQEIHEEKPDLRALADRLKNNGKGYTS